MPSFVTKENVHEATDVPKIRRLMANAERLGETCMFFRAECFVSVQEPTKEQHAFPKRDRKSGAKIDGSKARATDRVAPALSLRQLQFGGTSILAVHLW